MEAISPKFKAACNILGVRTSATLPEIRENFKKLVLIHHPDKGGKHDTFNMIKNAYNYIYIVKQNQEKQEKREKMNLSQYLQQRNLQSSMINNMANNGNNMYYASELNDSSAFNEHFEKNKTHDAYDEGREHFLKQNNTPKQMQIAIVKEPCGFNGTFIENVRNCNGDETVSDYSTYVNKNKNKRNTSCFDIQHAYANNPILENNMPNCREDTYLTTNAISKFKSERNNINIPTTTCNTQRELFTNLQQKEKKEQEQNRQYLMQKQKEIMERQFLRI